MITCRFGSSAEKSALHALPTKVRGEVAVTAGFVPFKVPGSPVVENCVSLSFELVGFVFTAHFRTFSGWIDSDVHWGYEIWILKSPWPFHFRTFSGWIDSDVHWGYERFGF